MVVIKVNFGGDLRRITLDENIPLNVATEKLKKLYNLPLTTFDVDILWVSEDGTQKELVNTDKKFQEAVSRGLNSSNKILRLELQRCQRGQQKSVTEEKEILERPDVRHKLEEIILETVQSKQFLDIIADKLSLYLKETMETKTEVKEDRPPEEDSTVEITEEQLSQLEALKEPKEVPANNKEEEAKMKNMIVESSKKSVPSVFGSWRKVLLKSDPKPVEPVRAISQVEKSEQTEVASPSKTDTKPPSIETASTIQELPVEEEKEPSIAKKEEVQREDPATREDVEKKVGEEQMAVVVEESAVEQGREEKEAEEMPALSIVPPVNREQNATPPIFRPFKAIFKAFKKEEAQKTPEREIPKEELDEMVKQLNDMGFTSDEANRKALKFHYKYGEGLDAVIEDLLTQRESAAQGDKPKEGPVKEEKPLDESDEQPLEPKNEKAERKAEEKKLEQTQVERKEDKKPGTAGDSVMADSFSDEDVEDFMAHANISKAAAIKALKAQAW